MTMLERHEEGNASQARGTSNTSIEEGDPLRTLLRTQTEMLQRLADGASDSITSKNRVKLSTIKLPTFDGKTEEWTEFSDAFVKTIHSNQVLPNI